MAWLKHQYSRVPPSLSTKWWFVKAPRLVAIAILTLLPAFAVAADVLPPGQFPKSGGEPAPGIIPEGPSESSAPTIPPSRIDPGIQHSPERRGDPRGSVKPPNLDPSMSTNPDKSLPERQGINPPGGGTPQGKPDVR
ncbi:MAG: hypothetical protein EHM80_15390 [Nitrospiraceae bacterium]|nr:MAG: hypothetical protein EHM80_15390 [Nitrospiraceae bacterium]